MGFEKIKSFPVHIDTGRSHQLLYFTNDFKGVIVVFWSSKLTHCRLIITHES